MTLATAAQPKPQVRPHDVLVIGAGGAGLRAAIEAKIGRRGRRARLQVPPRQGPHGHGRGRGRGRALGNVAAADSWQIHFRDTMVGGKLLNNPRMAELHATEAPARVRELELWGAVFDRTADGRILQRPFGGHSHPRLAHVGDRTGLEMIRTLQDRAVALGIHGLHGVHDLPPDHGARLGSPGRSATGGRPGSRSCSRPSRSCWRPAASARPTRSPPTPGSTAATARPWPTRPAPS